MHLPHGLRWPFLGQIENFQMLMTFWVIMNKSQGEAISKRKKRCNSIMLKHEALSEPNVISDGQADKHEDGH